MPSGSPIISVQDATLRYKRDAPPIVTSASLEILDGDALGIAGESGCGKTTLARAITGQLHPSSGTVLVDGIPWREVRRRSPQRREVQMIFQDPYSALNPRLTSRAALIETLTVVRRLSRSEAATQALELLDRVGLSGRAIERSPRDLSGGQRQRVVIARALACQPRLLVADEPTSSLDVSVQAQILNLLLDLRAEHNVALILVTHNLSVLNHMTDETLVMEAGQIVERGPTSQILEAPEHPFTQALVAARSPHVPKC